MRMGIATLLLGCWTTLGLGQTLAINEFLASNDACCPDEHGDFDDWVELYNYGDEPVDLAGLWFNDDDDDSGWQIPAGFPEITTVAPGGFIVVWYDEDLEQGPLHVNTKLSVNGETIVVFLPDGVTELVRYDFGPQTTDISEGRASDGDGPWVFFPEPTPGASNQLTAVVPPVLRPTGLELLGAQPNPFNPATTVRYRLDAPAAVRLRVIDLLGREVVTADLGRQPAGEGAWQWAPAPGLASGSYWLQLEAGGGRDAIKMLYLR
jgi:hypothetical protein